MATLSIRNNFRSAFGWKLYGHCVTNINTTAESNRHSAHLLDTIPNHYLFINGFTLISVMTPAKKRKNENVSIIIVVVTPWTNDDSHSQLDENGKKFVNGTNARREINNSKSKHLNNVIRTAWTHISDFSFASVATPNIFWRCCVA